uniref:BTB domain-containing protein n=1 Tax=Strongyloides papillosus TaxID=174720 RepID=A0A0N5C693_STREA
MPYDEGIFIKKEVVETPIDNVFKNSSFTSSFYELYRNSCGVDFKIICKGKTFNVHKIVLIAHSPVLRTMLVEHKETKECIENTLNIDWVEIPTLQLMINFMYTGTIPDTLSGDEFVDLLQLADRYNITLLHTLCQDRLIKLHLLELNVYELLKVSDTFTAQFLMDACIKMVILIFLFY